jgi:hypothetical protein
MAPRRVGRALVLSLSAACSASPGAVTVEETGALGQPIPVTVGDDVLVVPVTVDGVTGGLVVDTGSPVVALDPTPFQGATLPRGGGTLPALTLGGLTFHQLPVVGANLISSPDSTVPMDGSLGCSVLCAYAVSLNYRDATLTFAATGSPSHVEAPGATVPFSLLGGGESTVPMVPGTVDFPRSRVLVTAVLEGVTHSLVVDTGSTYVVVRQSVFETLAGDGRTTLSGVDTAGVGGRSSASVTRVRSFSVGGEDVAGLVASASSSFDASLDDVSAEVGSTVDGLVGGSFLRDFYVTVDYPREELVLQRYTEGAPTFDGFDRVGVLVADDGTVAQVFAGSDAEKQGVAVGDVIVAIDGTALAGLGAFAIEGLLSGPVGSTKSVALSGMQELGIEVDDVLAL